MAWTQALSGKAFDLSAPDASMVDFENDVAPALAKLARFHGSTEGEFAYSVAQHCVLGAESLFEATGNQRLAAIFLLHDAHESVIGEIPTPTVEQLDEDMGLWPSGYLSAIKYRIDCAIFQSAGIAMPDDGERAAIKRHDVAMMNAERMALKAPAPRSWGASIDAVPPAVLAEPIEPWPTWAAQEEWLAAFERFVGMGR